MHVVFVTYVYPPEHAPGGVMIQELAEDFARAGHRVTVVTGWPSHPMGHLFAGWRSRWRQRTRHADGYDVLRCGHSFGPRRGIVGRLVYYLTFAVGSFVGLLSLGRVDVVVCASTPIFGTWATWLAARLKGARFDRDIADLQPEAMRTAGILRDGLAYRLLRAQDTALCRRADGITTLSEAMRRGLETRGVAPEKIRVILFWLDGQKIRPGRRDNAWRRAQGIPAETFVAMYAGTIGYVSGAEVLTDVAERLADRKDILLLIVGEGPVKDALQTKAAERKLTNMRFLPFQPAEVLNDMQAAADVGLVTLLPQAGENSVPSKVLGYLAAGRAVIAGVHESSPTAEAIRAGCCGTVVPPQDPVALAEAICHAADAPQELAEQGRNARAHFLAGYDRRQSVKQWTEFLTSLVQRGKTTTPRIADQEDITQPLSPSRRWWGVKYAIERLVGLVGLVVISPLLLVLAAVVKLTSRGPVFYVSERIGKGGKIFRLVKFRTMKVGVEQVLSEDGKVITAADDPRFTPIGKFLRLGFDELPQLISVVKGDMCLIGPRPDVPWEMETYSPRERIRLHVLPGITGLTQVLGGRELRSAQNYELDVRYVAWANGWTDLAIAALTLPYSFGARRIGRRVLQRYMEGLEAYVHRRGYKAS